ncbi:MAG TPA: MMPL family transporter, partial [Methylomirabilota bacterium]|nr:MMPL family transporter [Methylomirabilota bacterium]
MFTRWGGFVYRRRRWIAAVALVLAGGFGSLASGAADELSNGGWLDPTSESAQVADRLEADFGGGRSAFVTLFRATDPNASATSAEFQSAITSSLAPVLDIDGVTGLTGYAQTGDERFVSEQGDAAYVLVGLDVDEDSSIDLVDPVQAAIRDATPAGYTVQLTGFGPIQQDSARLSEQDLVRAETVSLPIAALVLIFVFGSLIAAGMPLLVAGLAIPSSVGIIALVARQTEMSIYVLNIATMLGLALAIDYSLFITSRFR